MSDNALWHVQALAGNAAVGEIIDLLRPAARPVPRVQRQPPPGPNDGGQPGGGGGAAPGLTPEQERQLLYATTTLKKVEPLAEGDRKTLNDAIAGAPIAELIHQRDEKQKQVEPKRNELEQMKKDMASPPENGPPPTQDMVDAAAKELETLTTDLDKLNDQIKSEVAALGVGSERQLLDLVEERFPRLFVDRGKKIALTELDENQKILDDEAKRYGINACVDPAARQSLIKAAQDLVAHDQQIKELQDAVDQVRSSVDLPSGGTPDPEQMGSSYNDLLQRQQHLNQAIKDRNDLRGRYGLEHPILLRDDVDLNVLASGNEEQINAMVGGKLDEIANNIADTKENIKSETLQIWNLNNIVDMTIQDLGIGTNQTLQTAVQKHIQNVQADEAMLKIAVAALAFTAGIIATVMTGGVALVAGTVAVGAGAYTASQSVQSYLAESAAGDVALDPRIADISTKHPDLFWLVLDLIGAVADIAQVVKVFGELVEAARALKGAEDIAEFERAARATSLPPEIADQLVLNAARQDPKLALLANKFTQLTHTPRDAALHELLEEAKAAGIEIRTDEEAQRLLDWAARAEGADPKSYHAVTIGDCIFVRPEHSANVRVLREELIHVFQQRAGVASNEVVEAELQARLIIIASRHRWSITNDEVREMIREVRQMRLTGKY